MTVQDLPLSGKRIGVFGKGGSGKSTVVVLLARALAARGYAVCVLDADSTNVGMHEALGIEEAPAPLLDYFGGMIFSGGLVTCPVDDPTPLPNAHISQETLPADYWAQAAGGILLLTAGKIGDKGPGAGCDGPIAKIARDVRLVGPGPHAVTLIDFKAGFEDSARGAIISLDRVLVVVDPTRAALQMAAHMRGMVTALSEGRPPATQHLEDPALAALMRRLFGSARIEAVDIVLNRVPDAQSEAYLRDRLSQDGIEPAGVLHEDAAIARAWLHGTPLDSETAVAEADRIAAALEARVPTHVSVPEPAKT